MAATAPPPVPHSRAMALLSALNARANARLALNQTLLEMETRLARGEPVPMETLQEFERRMAELRGAQERAAMLATSK